LSAGVTVQDLLRQSGLPPQEARALMAYAASVPRETLIAHPQRVPEALVAARFAQLAERRQTGVPMAYLLGVQEFLGREFLVTPDVLIPRPETELLVECALDAIASLQAPRVLELGTGSGCVAISLALARPDAIVTASDASGAALAVAAGNARRLGVKLALLASDWYGAIGGRFDLVVSNPPYVARCDPHLDSLRFEPRTALTDEGDGLGALRVILSGAPGHLGPGGRVMVEHGYDQGEAVRDLMRRAGFQDASTLRDLAGHERIGLGGNFRGN
jgi:release factor glutamine methyltransferase